MASLHNPKTYQKGKIDMTKAQTINKLQKVVDKNSKYLDSFIYIDFYNMDNDSLYALAENDCKQLKQMMLKITSVLKD